MNEIAATAVFYVDPGCNLETLAAYNQQCLHDLRKLAGVENGHPFTGLSRTKNGSILDV